MNRLRNGLLTGLLILMVSTYAVAEYLVTIPVPTLPPPAGMHPDITAAPVTERPYVPGDSGADVYAFKKRLQYLGYFRRSAELSYKISKITMERVNELLTNNGMEPVERISTEIQRMIFTRDDLAIAPTPTPSPIPKPFISPQGTPPLPPHDADGFLEDPDGEFVFADAADGLWYYLSGTLYINIRRYNDQQEENIWLEAEIKTRGGERLQSYGEETRKTRGVPVAFARDNQIVLAFTDDYFTTRSYGVVIRDGVIYRDYIRRTSRSYPLGDTLAVLADGGMYVYDFDAYSAEEFLGMGAVHVLSFGPWLLRDGVINPRLLTGDYMHYHEPRCAFGMIAPGHYVVIAVDGRYDGAKGAYIEWVAARMQRMGVAEAINLDGGGTTALVFMGKQISRVSNAREDGKNTRRVNSVLGFGNSEAVGEKE